MAGGGEPWHLDRKVPIALIFALAVQTAGVTWWASTMQANLAAQTETNERQEAAIEGLKADVQAKADRFVEVQRVLSEQLVEQRADLRAIRDLMQRIEARLDQPQRRQ